MKKVSIIIPTYNEEDSLPGLLKYLQLHSDERLVEIIVADGQSVDRTLDKALEYGARPLLCMNKGRSSQMNEGAAIARGELLYFVHADTLPPSTFLEDIVSASNNGYSLGSYRSSYITNDPRLKINAFFTRFDFLWCRGGDQTLFVDKQLFDQLGGFCADHRIMEDFDFLKRARKYGRFIIMPKGALISTRKYNENSYFRVNIANMCVFVLYSFGASQEKLTSTYKNILRLERY